MLMYIYLMHTKTTHIHSPSGLEPITAGKHLLLRLAPLCTLSLCQLRLSLAKGEKDDEEKQNSNSPKATSLVPNRLAG